MFRKVEIRSFNTSSYTADVRVSGSYTVMLEGVKVAKNIPSSEMIAGRQALLAFFDEYNPSDAVVIAVFIA